MALSGMSVSAEQPYRLITSKSGAGCWFPTAIWSCSVANRPCSGENIFLIFSPFSRSTFHEYLRSEVTDVWLTIMPIVRFRYLSMFSRKMSRPVATIAVDCSLVYSASRRVSCLSRMLLRRCSPMTAFAPGRSTEFSMTAPLPITQPDPTTEWMTVASGAIDASAATRRGSMPMASRTLRVSLSGSMFEPVLALR